MRGSLTPAQLNVEISAVLEGRFQGCAALATVISRSGSAPQITGAKMLVRADGQIFGTVGGGAIEAKVIDACESAIRFGRSARVEANLVRDLGMCCGGSMELFVEFLQSPARVFVIGAGHVSQALVPLARAVDFNVSVFDDREELLEHAAFADAYTRAYDADELFDALRGSPRAPATQASEAGPSVQLRASDYVIIVTRDHRRDEDALAFLLTQRCAYLGMIGSRRKVHTVLARVLRRFDERDLERPSLAHVRAPIGLALGGRSPMEIAVSIVAELVAHRHKGTGASMSIVDELPGASPEPRLADKAEADAEAG